MTQITAATARAAAATLAAWLPTLPPDERAVIEAALAIAIAALGTNPVDGPDTAGFAASLPAPTTAFGYARLLGMSGSVSTSALTVDDLLPAFTKLVVQGG